MLEEAREAPAAVARQLRHDDDAYREFGAGLRRDAPSAMLTIARGSSDHAAHFAGYLIMARYHAKIPCAGLVSMAFSQSGQSPDLVQPMRFFTDGGATTAAFVNDIHSPLAQAAKWVFPLHAGEEIGIAATKSFITQLVAGTRLVAAWQPDEATTSAIRELPAALALAADADWSAGVEALADADRIFVVGRGTGLAIAMEAALKLKETCAIQAEAFSGAEVQHGPMALVTRDYPILVFAPRGPAQPGLLAVADEMRARGARVLLAAPAGTPACDLVLAPAPSPELDPIAAIQSFYIMAEALSRARGLDPDRPPHLAKVTRTH